MDRDLKHLKILSFGYYFCAAVCGLIFMLPLLYIFTAHLQVMTESTAMGMSWYLHGDPNIGEMFQQGQTNSFFMVFVMIFGFGFGLPLLAMIIANYYCAKSLRRQKNYTFCLVMAGLNTASPPFGMVLGIFSLVVLLRDSTKSLFQ